MRRRTAPEPGVPRSPCSIGAASKKRERETGRLVPAERGLYHLGDSQNRSAMRPAFYEFFAGGGMAAEGLGRHWRCLFANDIDAMKARAHRLNHPHAPFLLKDIQDLSAVDLPGAADLAWASFPCQDLSLAGNGAGLKGARSGLFWTFWRLMEGLAREGRAPKIVAIENVIGAVTSHQGRDLAAIAGAFAGLGYCFGCLVIDAVHFTPQSRPRLFIIGVRGDVLVPQPLLADDPSPLWSPPALLRSIEKFPARVASRLVNWRLPEPPRRNVGLADLIEDAPTGVAWHDAAATRRLLSLMDENNLEKVRAAKREKRRRVGAVYRRTRPDGKGGKIQRAEVRFDDIAGCLRTPAGGSSRQTILIVEGARVRSRLLSAREAARLMGLHDDYILPERYNDAYHLAGDGVAVPVVRFLAENLFEPILARRIVKAAA